MMKRNTLRLFETRKGHLEHRVRQDYVRNGIATIPCRVSGYDDIISSYSVEGYESLNPEFVDYLKDAADVVPAECPLVLDVIGGSLSQDERNTIEETIRDDFAYDLGVVEKEEARHVRTFVFMLVGLVLSGLVLWFTEALAEEPREVLFILFWFMGDTLCDYLFLTGHDLRRERRLAGRLASIKVIFSESYRGPDRTEEEYERLCSEIEKDVRSTILGDGKPNS